MGHYRDLIRETQGEELQILALRDVDAKRRLSLTTDALVLTSLVAMLITVGAGWSGRSTNVARGLAEQELRESEGRYQMLLDGVQDSAIFTVNTKGQVASWNAGAERIKGYRADEIIGRNFSCFFLAEYSEQGRPEEVFRMTAACGRHAVAPGVPVIV
jgi:PAS domain-containing protein